MLIRTKIMVRVNKSEPNIPSSHETLDLDNSPKKNEMPKSRFYFEFNAERAF